MSESLLSELEAFALNFAQNRETLIARCKKNEQQTKNSLIEPYIKNVLGFDTFDPKQVWVEYQTATVKAADKVDYALMYGEDPITYIEAKSLSHKDLSQAIPMNKQLRSYMLDSTTVKFGAITDGRTWIWYYKENYQHEPSPFLLIDTLSDSQDKSIEWLSLLRSRAPVADLLSAAKSEFLTSRIRNWFEKSLQDPGNALAKFLLKEIGQPSGQRARLELCKRSWKRAVGSYVGVAEKPITSATSTPQPPKPGRLTCFIRYSNGNQIALKNATDLMIEVVRFCSENHREGKHDYYQRISQPLESPKNYPAIMTVAEVESSEYPTKHYSRGSFDGYRIFRNLNNSAKVPMIEALLKECTLESGKSPQIGRELEVHMPNTVLQIPDLDLKN